MDIRKGAVLAQGGSPDAAQLERINRQAKTPLTAEQVYVFSVRLCDDQVDRDGERFDTAALPKLAELFLGKTGICDHNWSAKAQVARIFDTAVVQEGAVSYIKAWAYVLRAHQEQLIAEIEGGIRREVSVGCAMGGRHCSVCGERECGHVRGEVYDGQLCCDVLTDPVDAYEFSFVAVPAQPEAGVLKHRKGGEEMTLEQMATQAGEAAAQELKTLREQAALAAQLLEEQREELVRCGKLLEPELERATLARMVQALDAAELKTLLGLWQGRCKARYPDGAQLTRREAEREAFLI